MKIDFTKRLTEEEKELTFPSGRKISSIPNRTDAEGHEIHKLIAKALSKPELKKTKQLSQPKK